MPERIASTTITTSTSISVNPFLYAGIARRDWTPKSQASSRFAQAAGLLRGLLLCLALEKVGVLAVPLGLQAIGGNESEGRRVHAVPQAGRARPVVEHMAKVRVSVRRANLGAVVRSEERRVGEGGEAGWAAWPDK